MIIRKKFIFGFILSIILGFTLSYRVSASAPITKRLAGADRYETSLKVAQDGWSSSYYAVLACGEDYPDALSSVPLAKKYDAPVLLSHRNYVDSYIIDEMKKLNVGRVFIIGGTASISDNIINQLSSIGIQTERIGGTDRYDTSVKIAEKFGKVNTLMAATGQDYADAVSIGTAAAAMGVPVILLPKDVMPDSTKKYIEALNTTINADYNNPQKGQTSDGSNQGQFRNMKVFVVGDNSVISDNVIREFENTFRDDVSDQQFGNVERIGGADKYERNINVIARFVENYNTSGDYTSSGDLFSMNNLYIASGDGFADALSGAAEAAKSKSPVILSASSNLELIKNFILTKIPDDNEDNDVPEYLTILGGQLVLPDTRVNDIFGTLLGDENVSTGDSSVTDFKDSNLEKLIRKKVGKTTGTLNYSDLKNITSLDLSNEGITNIAGLENCTNLSSLDLSFNQISSVKPLFRLYNLQDLNLSHNKISDVSYLSNITGLKQLDLSDNDISTLSYYRKDSSDDDSDDEDKVSGSVFKYMTGLTSLNLSNSNVSGSYSYKNSIDSSDLDNLKGLTNLVSLNLKGTNIGSLANLEKITSLNTLNLSSSSVSNLNSLEKLTNLTWLDLSDNDSIDGDDLKPLQDLTELKYLNLSGNDINKLTYLNKLSNLTTLYLEDNPILDYTPILPYEKSLYYRDFDINNISGQTVYSLDDTINAQIKQQINDFQISYNYSNYDKLKFRVLYGSYGTGAYSGVLENLKNESQWLNEKITYGGLSDEQLRDVRLDLSNTQNEIADISKKDEMNMKVKSLENQLSTSYNALDMERIINRINYIYSDYRYDYYRNLADRASEDVQNIEARIQTIGLQSPGYSSSNIIDDLQNTLEQRQKERNFAQEKITMYDNYRNFFNAVGEVIDEN
ncbi:cell wall-binding repeat-containing protein [Clostridium sp. JNZ X4-2]